MGPLRFRRTANGNYSIGLDDHERTVIRELPQELIKLLEAGDDDGSIFRLFPPGYGNDLGRQLEYDRLMRDELQKRHVESLQILIETSERPELTEDELHGWIRAINQLRLVLGTRLAITNDWRPEDLASEDPRVSAYALYEYLGFIQEDAVQAMAEGLD